MESLGDHSLSLPCVSLEPALNTYYFVKGSDYSLYVGEIIQMREMELDNEKKRNFFIHYKDYKKLLMCSLRMCPLVCMSQEIKPIPTIKIGLSKSLASQFVK